MVVRPKILGDVLELIYEKDAFATLTKIRLANKRELLMFLHVCFQSIGLLWQQKAYRRKSKLLLKSLAHPVGHTGEDFLARQVLQEGIPIPVEFILLQSLHVLLVNGQCIPDHVPTHICFSKLVFENYMLKELELAAAEACINVEGVFRLFRL